ncbi:hypothetical protein CRG98_019785 [Punica granatum]|uniref:Uncharacterized protein n=1 Tax=Punica granatum TaxID=22663 RepID=A0A2I0JU50_PUNGR|nr:hypothetical protein CRG98_019785 [Punica granatum]
MSSWVYRFVQGRHEEINDSPIEEVRLTVPATDDPTPACPDLCLKPLSVSSVSVQVVALPIGKIMAATSKVIKVLLTRWSFSMNPGPFNLKKQVPITIFANCRAGEVYAVAFYHRSIHPAAAFLLSQTT